MTSLRTIILVALIAVGFACGGNDSSPTAPSPGPTSAPAPAPAPVGTSAAVTIPMGASPLGDRAYSPDAITIAVGSTVTWVNTDTVPHTSSANAGSWNSDTIAPGQQFSATLRTAGTFPYHCSIHPGMVGTVTVR